MNKIICFSRKDLIPYCKGMFYLKYSLEDIDYAIYYMHRFLGIQDGKKTERDLSFKDKMRSIIFELLLSDRKWDVDSFTDNDYDKAIKAIIPYYKKEMIHKKQVYREHDKESKAHDLLYHGALNIEYHGDANKKMLNCVVSSLKLFGKLQKKSVIVIDGYSRKVDVSDPKQRFELWDLKARGYISIDGIEYKFADVTYDHGGWDPFPPS